MEYREPPRIAATERRLDGVVDDAKPGPRLRRFEFVRSQRQLDLPRLLLALVIGAAALAVAGYLAAQISRSAVSWLHEQPQYQVRFLDITLKPPPPKWFRGGSESFLRQVRDNAREGEVLQVLDLPKGDIARDQIAVDFKKFPWVQNVPQVEYPPHGIVVHLVYRVPVAWMHFPPAPAVYLDREACLLPVEDVDRTLLGPLIRITGQGLERGSADNRPGIAWRSSATGAEAARMNKSLESAAALAAFLLQPDHAEETAATPALRFIRIEAADPRGLWIESAEHAMILWGDAPGEEDVGTPAAEEKWSVLRKWAKNSDQHALPAGDYWRFSRSELVPVRVDPD